MKQQTVLIGAVIAIAISGGVLYKFFAKPRSVDAATQSLFDAYTQVAAQEVSRLLGGRGGVVVLMWGPPADDARDPNGPPVVQAFCRALPRFGLRLLAKEQVAPVPEGYDIVWTAENYRSALERYPQAAALVSFVGDPQLSAENIHELPAHRPRLIVVRGGKVEAARKLFELGILDGAVLPCMEAPANDRPPKSAREWFDRFYLFVTPQSAAELH